MDNILQQYKINYINAICKRYKINDYTINKDGSIDAKGNVYLRENKLSRLPINFNRVEGTFDCSVNKLTTLEGCPVYVGGNFKCANNLLTSLEYAPKIVEGNEFNCADNKLTTLKGCPTQLNALNCSGRNILTTLDYYPTNLISHLKHSTQEFRGTFKPFGQLDPSQRRTFIRYQDYYEVWLDDKFNLDKFNELRDDILDGLR